MTNLNNILPENDFGPESSQAKTQVQVSNEIVDKTLRALTSCEDIEDYITIFEEFILQQTLMGKEKSSI
ncbi:MAG: hypothetical protein ACXWE6_14180 [Nitrososphaeraceae archaeon]